MTTYIYFILCLVNKLAHRRDHRSKWSEKDLMYVQILSLRGTCDQQLYLYEQNGTKVTNIITACNQNCYAIRSVTCEVICNFFAAVISYLMGTEVEQNQKCFFAKGENYFTQSCLARQGLCAAMYDLILWEIESPMAPCSGSFKHKLEANAARSLTK